MKKTGLGYRYPFAIVGFGGRRTKWWMRFLKKGFYHCVLVLGNGYEWIFIDPLAHYTDAIILRDIDVISFLKKNGYQVLTAQPEIPQDTRMRFRPYTCVETVLRFLGIKSPFILTPYQLFCFLSQKIGK